MRFAFVGLGRATRLYHVPAVRALADAAAVGGADPSEQQRAAWSAETGTPAFATLEELLERTSPEVVVVATPPASHAANRRSASEMFSRYHPVQAPALSPATRSTACRAGSNTNRIRISLRPVDPGRSSFTFRTDEPVMLSTSGLPSFGPSASSSSIAAATDLALPGSSTSRPRYQLATSSTRMTVPAMRPL